MTVEQKSPIPRRAIAKGIAWSVPAFAIATAAPALAQSPLVTFDPTGYVCKYPGGSVKPVKQAYFFPVAVNNISGERVRITAIDAYVMLDDGTRMDGAHQFWDGHPGDGSADADGILEVDDNKSGTWNFVVDNTGNSAMSAGTVYFTVTVLGLETGRTYEHTITLTFPETPPCDGSEGDVPPEDPPEVSSTSEDEEQSEVSSSTEDPAAGAVEDSSTETEIEETGTMQDAPAEESATEGASAAEESAGS